MLGKGADLGSHLGERCGRPHICAFHELRPFLSFWSEWAWQQFAMFSRSERQRLLPPCWLLSYSCSGGCSGPLYALRPKASGSPIDTCLYEIKKWRWRQGGGGVGGAELTPHRSWVINYFWPQMGGSGVQPLCRLVSSRAVNLGPAS